MSAGLTRRLRLDTEPVVLAVVGGVTILLNKVQGANVSRPVSSEMRKNIAKTFDL